MVLSTLQNTKVKKNQDDHYLPANHFANYQRILIDKRGAGLTDNILNRANFTWAISPSFILRHKN